MFKYRILLTALASSCIAIPAFAAEGPADVDYDCALYNECEVAGTEDAGAVRGGFTLRRIEGAKPQAAASATTQRPAQTLAPQRQPARIAAPKSKVAGPAGEMQAASLKASQLITFVSGSAELQPGAKQVAQKLATAMMRPDKLGQRFRIEGHTDAVGSRDANRALSERRARAVISYLGTLGVDMSRLDAVGYGSEQPISGTSPYSASNRRVVAKIAN